MGIESVSTAPRLDDYRRALDMQNVPRSLYGTQLAASSPMRSAETPSPVNMPRGTMATPTPKRLRGCRSSLIARALRPLVLLLASVSTILILLVALAVLMPGR